MGQCALLRRYHKHWDCLQYLVDNKCPEWEKYAKDTRIISDEMPTIDEYDLRTFSHSHPAFRCVIMR